MVLVAAGSIALVVASFVHLARLSQSVVKASALYQQPAGGTFPDSNWINNILTNTAEENP
jgi:hypothetical protein